MPKKEIIKQLGSRGIYLEMLLHFEERKDQRSSNFSQCFTLLQLKEKHSVA